MSVCVCERERERERESTNLPCLSQEGLFSASVLLHQEVLLLPLHSGLVQVPPGGGQVLLGGHQSIAGLLQPLRCLLQLCLGVSEKSVELREGGRKRGRKGKREEGKEEAQVKEIGREQ